MTNPSSQIKAGSNWKWWVLILNWVGNIVLFRELLAYNKLKLQLPDPALLQWKVGIGFTYMTWVMWPSLLVLISTAIFLRSKSDGDSSSKWTYLVIATTSILLPILLVCLS